MTANVVSIDGRNVEFPYVPYPGQVDVMEGVIKGVKSVRPHHPVLASLFTS